MTHNIRPLDSFNSLGQNLKALGQTDFSGELKRVFTSDDGQFGLLLYTGSAPLQGDRFAKDGVVLQGVFDAILQNTGAAGVYATQALKEFTRLQNPLTPGNKLKLLKKIIELEKTDFPGVLIAVEMDYDFYPHGSHEKMSHEQ